MNKTEFNSTKRKSWTSRAAGAAAVLSLSTALLSGCMSEQDIAAAEGVITALPTEVEGCTFLGNVDTVPRVVITNARFDLKLKAASLGATHVVETFAYPALLTGGWDYGVALSGRAYLCPQGKGPILPKKEAELPAPDMPTPPSVNFDDDWF